VHSVGSPRRCPRDSGRSPSLAARRRRQSGVGARVCGGRRPPLPRAPGRSGPSWRVRRLVREVRRGRNGLSRSRGGCHLDMGGPQTALGCARAAARG
jgi:hypothetical protein